MASRSDSFIFSHTGGGKGRGRWECCYHWPHPFHPTICMSATATGQALSVPWLPPTYLLALLLLEHFLAAGCQVAIHAAPGLMGDFHPPGCTAFGCPAGLLLLFLWHPQAKLSACLSFWPCCCWDTSRPLATEQLPVLLLASWELFAIMAILLLAALLCCSCLAQGESAQIYVLQHSLPPVEHHHPRHLACHRLWAGECWPSHLLGAVVLGYGLQAEPGTLQAPGPGGCCSCRASCVRWAWGCSWPPLASISPVAALPSAVAGTLPSTQLTTKPQLLPSSCHYRHLELPHARHKPGRVALHGFSRCLAGRKRQLHRHLPCLTLAQLLFFYCKIRASSG